MSSNESNVYVRKTSKEGQEILCPIEDVIRDETEECVEQDVVGRYAGNIEVRSEGSKPDDK